MSQGDKVVRLENLRAHFGQKHGNHHWVYRAASLLHADCLPSWHEIAEQAGTKYKNDPRMVATRAILKLAGKARQGDNAALRSLVNTISDGIQELELLSRENPEVVKVEAESMPYWPVRLSLNPQDIQAAKVHLKQLGLGTKAATPTKPGQRIDRRDFWSLLAQRARRVCLYNGALVPLLKNHTRGAIERRREQKFFGTGFKAIQYDLPNGDYILISDWQKDCVTLPDDVREENFGQWWRTIQACIIDHWWSNPADYKEALSKIGHNNKQKNFTEAEARNVKEFSKRNRAIYRLKQSFRSLVGLH